MLRHLELRDFRNFGRLSLELADGFTVLWGHNGAGKTNIIEAIYLVATLRSFRTADLRPLLRTGAAEAAVSLDVFDDFVDLTSNLAVRLIQTGSSLRRQASADTKIVRSAVDFYGRVQAVLFTPEDLAVLRGPPAARRQFLDRMLFARDRQHLVDVSAYEKLLRSRNHVLRDQNISVAERDRLLGTYEQGLCDSGSRIWQRREDLVRDLLPLLRQGFMEIHGAYGPWSPSGSNAALPEVELRYESTLQADQGTQKCEQLARELRDRRGRDIQRGVTSIGPHRDDVIVCLDGQVAATVASQGQTRAIVLALKLAELELARIQQEKPPLLLLDDVSSELDPGRTQALFAMLGPRVGQCVLTTTADHFVKLPKNANAHWVRIACGSIVKKGGDPDP